MEQFHAVLLVLFGVGFAAFVAKRSGIPAPILYVALGMLMALPEGMPKLEVAPELLLPLFLPPILMDAAYFTSFRDFRANLRPILLLAIGFVVVTCVGVAWLLQGLVPGIGWPAALLVGAIISPPDAVAITSVARRVKLPRRVKSILEGESLVNDATGLVLYKLALAVVLSGWVSVGEVAGSFALAVTGGLALGVAGGYAFIKLHPYIWDKLVSLLATVLLPYAMYQAAEAVHASGVLAVVACGLVVGWYAPVRFNASMRLPSESVWRMLTFVLNGVIFIIVGMQLPGVVAALEEYRWEQLGGWALALFAALIIIRVIWVAALHLADCCLPFIKKRDTFLPWQNFTLISWTAMRGVVSMALALALPLVLSNGEPFPHRDLISFLAFSVIVLSLLVQGATLPLMLKRLSIPDTEAEKREHMTARRLASEQALSVLESLKGLHDRDMLERIAEHYRTRMDAIDDIAGQRGETLEQHPAMLAEHKAWNAALKAERRSIIGLRMDFLISDEIMHKLLHEVDLMQERYKLPK